MDFEQYAKEKSMVGAVTQSWVEAFDRHFLQHRDKSLKGLKVLDYGFGDGRYFDFFTKYFDLADIYGIEVSKIRVERARKRGWANASFIELGSTLPFPDSFFDFMNMVEVIEHIPRENADFYFGEIRRVLKERGTLMVTTPNYPIKRVYDIHDAVVKRKWARLKDDPTHVSLFNHKGLKHFLGRYFKSVTILGYKDGFLYKRTGREFFRHKILAVCTNH